MPGREIHNLHGVAKHASQQANNSQQRLEIELRESEDRLRLLADSTAEGIFCIDLEACCTFCNLAALRILQYESADQLIGKHLHRLIHHTRPDGTPYPTEECPILKALQKGESIHIQDEVLWKANGTSFHAEYWANPQRKDGKVVGAVVAFIDITRRQRAKRALERSEEKFFKAFHQSPVPMTVTSAIDHRYIDVNEQFIAVSGFAREEVIGRTPFDIGIWVIPNQRVELVQRLLTEHAFRDVQINFRRKDGSVGIGIVSATLVEIEGEQVVIGAVQDMTERDRAQKQVEESEQKFRTVFHDAPCGMVVGSLDGHLLAVNNAYCEFVGYTAEELVGNDFRFVTHPADVAASAMTLGKVVRGELSDVKIQKRYVHKGGQIRWGEATSSVIRDSAGNPAYIVSQVVDITERKRAEAALRENEQLLRVALDSAERQLRFETLLAEISARFVNVPANEIDCEIEKALETICKSLGIEHSSIHQMTVDDPSVFVMTHIFRDPALPRPPKNMNAKQFFPWCLNRVLANEIVSLRNTQEAPAEASVDMSSWKQFDIRSTLVIPLAAGGRKPVGCWGIDSIGRECDWKEMLAIRLKLIADVFANALERKHAEEKLLESEARLRLAAESANAGSWTLNLDTSALWTTSTTKQLFGLAENDDFDYEKFLGSIHPDDREGVQQVILSSTKGLGLVHEYRVFRPDGTVRWMLSRGSRYSGLGDGHNMLMGITVDVTDRKRMEQELRRRESELLQSEKRLRRVVEHISDALIVDDVDGSVVFANDQFLDIFGFRRDELSTIILEDYVAPEYRAELRDLHTRRIRGENVPTHFEYEGCRRDGRRMWLEVDVVPIIGPDGKISGTQSAIRDVTARKRMDEELRRRESQLREAQRIARVADWTWDPKTDVVTWSDELITMVGWDPKLPIPTWKQHAQFFSAESWHRLNEAVHKTLLTGLPYEVDTQSTQPDGTKAWFKNRGEVVRDSQGNINHLRGTVQDITEHKLAEDALRESEERYRSLVESSHDWIWEVDADGRYTYVGPQCRRIFGYEPEEILGRKPFDLMPTEEARRIAEAFGQIAKDRKPFRTLENVNLHKDGHLVVLETNGSPILDDRGKLIGYRGMDRDITRRKRAEEALIQSERKFATLFRTAPAAIGLNTLEGKFVDVNDAFEAVTGYSREEAVGHTALDLGLWVEPDKSEELRRSLSEQSGVRGIEHRFRTKKGDVRTGILSSDLIDISGEKYVLTVLGDVTEQKEAEKIQRELGGRLIRAQEEERKRIARELHDDINQRLALLAVQLQQLQGSPAQRKKQIEKLFKDTTAIASDIQALSHQLHSANLDYLGLVPAIQGFCDEQARKQKIKVNFTHSGVPNSISADVDLALFRITQEALHNAVKYSGVKQFEVSLAGTSEYVELVVRDPGVGFGPEAAMHGRGLGLIGMRERIVPLNGKISIVSKPKHGTEITVRVPWPQSDHSN